MGHTSLLQMIWSLSEGYAPFPSILQSTKIDSNPVSTSDIIITHVGPIGPEHIASILENLDDGMVWSVF